MSKAAPRTAVLYLAPWVTIGGSDRNTVEWVRLLDRDRFRPFLVTTQESDNELFGEAAEHAERAWDLARHCAGRDMPRAIAEIVDRYDIEVLHVMNSRLGLDLLPALKGAFPHVTSVVQLHAEEHPIGTGYPRYVAARLDASVDAYSVISDQLAAQMVTYGADPAKVRVVKLGVDTEQYRPEPSSAPRRRVPGLQVLFPARLTWQKDPLLMVRVAAGLRRAGSTAVIHVVGDGDLAEEVQAAVAAEGLNDTVVFHGPSTDMPPWYTSTDVTLLTSQYEGIPLTVYESLAMERPVVAADVGATSEVLTPEAGVLIAARDDPDAYVRALLRLEADPELRVEMGRRGRALVESEYTNARMVREHEILYEGLLAVAPERAEGSPDLRAFEDWWSEDSTPLHLTVDVDGGRAALRAGAGPSASPTVRVGRGVTTPSALTVPLVADGLDTAVHAWASPLPGMIDLAAVLPGHLEGLWRGAGGDGNPPPSPLRSHGPVWVDAPFLLPESTVAAPADGDDPPGRPRRPWWKRRGR